MPIDASLLRHFIAVARTGSFTDAAERIHASRPVLTRSVKRLEDQVGTRLFDRTTRSVRLTAAGEGLLTEAEAMLDRLAVAADRARRIGQGEPVSLKIGICPSAEPIKLQLGKAIQDFRAQWPDVEIKLTSSKRDLQPMALASAKLDAGLMVLNPKDRPVLEWRVIARSDLMLWLPGSWGFDGPSVRLADLHSRPWVLAHPLISPDHHELELMLCRNAGFEPQLLPFPDDRITGEMMRMCEQGAIFMHAWEAPGDPRLKRIEGLPDYCRSDMVIAWAKGGGSPHIGALAHVLSDSMTDGFV